MIQRLAAPVLGGLLFLLAGCETVYTEEPPVPQQVPGNIDVDAEYTLRKLYISAPEIRDLVKQGRGILIFPAMTEDEPGTGLYSGEGVLRVSGLPARHYRSVGHEFNLPSSLERFAYVLVFMTDSGLKTLNQANDWAVGGQLSLKVVNPGQTRQLGAIKPREDVYGFVLLEKSLLAGARLDGARILRSGR